MNTLGVSITATPLSYSTSIIQDISTASVDTVIELEYSLEMRSIYLFPPATVMPFIVQFLFSLINMLNYKILLF